MAGLALALAIIGGAYAGLRFGEYLPAIFVCLGIAIIASVVLFRTATWLVETWQWRSALLAVAGAATIATLALPLAYAGHWLADAMAYEVADNIRNSPKGGYYERREEESHPQLGR